VKPKLLLCLALVLSFAHWNIRAAESFELSTNFRGLVLNIHCTNLVLKLGDEIPIEFVISNGGVANYGYDDTDYGPSDSALEFQLTVKSSDGKMVPNPYANLRNGISGEWLGSARVLHPGECISKTYPLNAVAAIKLPGQYTLTGAYPGHFGSQSGVKSAPINITILPRTDLEMDAYISNLTNQFTGTNGMDSRERDSILMKLAFTCSPKIVHFMLNKMYASDDNYWPSEALVVYVPHSDATRTEIIGTALQHGLVEGMDEVLNQYGCTAEERQAILKQSLAEATSHLASSHIAEIYHLDVDNPRAEDRARLARDFPKLSPRNQFAALTYLWPRARCPEFDEALLPLAKPPETPEQPNDNTLCDEVCLRLLEIKPEAVRPLILVDLRREKPLFSLGVLQALPDKELPELDDVLLAHLNDRQADIWKTTPLIERYASARILPQVIDFYQTQEGKWACSIQTAILRYWLKYDRPAALRGIEKAVNFRKSTGCYHIVLGETLHDSFDADAEKVARKFVDDPDPEVAADAKRLLAEQAAKPAPTTHPN
jgi:hypothetical protein